MPYSATVRGHVHQFKNLKTLLAKASPLRSGDELAGVAAKSYEERVAAQIALADLPFSTFLTDHLIPYEADEVTRLIVDTHDATAFEPLESLTVGDFRDYLLSEKTTTETLRHSRPASRPKWQRRSANSCGCRIW